MPICTNCGRDVDTPTKMGCEPDTAICEECMQQNIGGLESLLTDEMFKKCEEPGMFCENHKQETHKPSTDFHGENLKKESKND